MTDILFHKLEEKIISLLTELEDLHQEIGQLRRENEKLIAEKVGAVDKLQNLVSLLDSFDLPEENTSAMSSASFNENSHYAENLT